MKWARNYQQFFELFRWRIGHPKLDRLRRDIIAWIDVPERRNDPELREIASFLRSNPPDFVPYPFSRDYHALETVVQMDEDVGLPFIDHQGHRLYWHAGRKLRRIPKDYHALLVEQDDRSPHRYLTPDFDVQPGDVVVDIGAAEGIFALEVVERAAHLYLFEADSLWVPALEATFRPWRDKVTIIPRFAADVTDKNSTRLDEFFANIPKIDFLKLDVEGAEARVLEGARQLITGGRVKKAAVCTYHNSEDASNLKRLLHTLGFETSFSRGYMLLFREDGLSPPYLRRGLLRATWRG